LYSRTGTSYTVYDYDDVDDEYENKLIEFCDQVSDFIYQQFENLCTILSGMYEGVYSEEYYVELSENNEWEYKEDGSII